MNEPDDINRSPHVVGSPYYEPTEDEIVEMAATEEWQREYKRRWDALWAEAELEACEDR